MHALVGEARARSRTVPVAARWPRDSRSPRPARAAPPRPDPRRCRRDRARASPRAARGAPAPTAVRNWRTRRTSSPSIAMTTTAPGCSTSSRVCCRPSASATVSMRNVRYRPRWMTRRSSVVSKRSRSSTVRSIGPVPCAPGGAGAVRGDPEHVEWCAHALPVLVRRGHGGDPRVRPKSRLVGGSPTTPAIETEHSSSSRPGLLCPPHGDCVMTRYSNLAIRLAAIAAFVLVLAAPLRW